MKPFKTPISLCFCLLLSISSTAIVQTGCGGDTEEVKEDTQGDFAISGRVVVPNGSTGVPSATVTVLDQLQFEITQVVSDEKGEFGVDFGALNGDGTYILTAKSGPYSGPERPMRFEVIEGHSDYQILKLNGSP